MSALGKAPAGDLAPNPDGCCVVVGATGAVGQAVVERLAGAGWPVVALARRADELEQLKASCPELISTLPVDLSSDEAVQTVAGQLDRPVSLAFFAAGLAVTGSADSMPPSDLAVACNVKVAGMARLVQAVRGHLEPGSRLLAVAGSLGLEPGPMDAAPGTVNAALLNLMRQYSQLYGPAGIITCTLMLGPLDTPRLRAFADRRADESGRAAEDVLREYAEATSLGRLPTPAEVAWLVESLMAPQAWLLHGAAICADAGVRRLIF
ncbi:MAG: SDR family NAD(P)-dependent oxidoreductase [Actinomycetales bacterium]